MSTKDKMISDLRELATFLERGDTKLGDNNIQNLLLPLSLSFFPRIYEIEKKLDLLLERPNRVECRLSGSNGDNLIRLIVQSDQRQKAIRHLKECLDSAVGLTICDPYFLKEQKLAVSDYVKSIEAILPETLKKLEVFVATGTNHRNEQVAAVINSLCESRGIELSCWKTPAIHDRVWIVDGSRAYVVGTSFHGLGDKCAFILPLPEEDMLEFMQEINNLQPNLVKSNSV